jgi:hypothetical protein
MINLAGACEVQFVAQHLQERGAQCGQGEGQGLMYGLHNSFSRLPAAGGRKLLLSMMPLQVKLAILSIVAFKVVKHAAPYKVPSRNFAVILQPLVNS